MRLCALLLQPLHEFLSFCAAGSSLGRVSNFKTPSRTAAETAESIAIIDKLLHRGSLSLVFSKSKATRITSENCKPAQISSEI